MATLTTRGSIGLEEQVRWLWEQDSAYDDEEKMSVEDKEVMTLWSQLVVQIDGHYQLAILFHQDDRELPNNDAC